jgi:hypothetical protein
MKTPVIMSEDYTVFLEYYQGLSIVHCDCYKWSKDVKRQLTEDWNKLVSIHRKPIYAIHEIDDEKHLKFLTMMGFSLNNNFVGADGKERQLFVRSNQHGY